MVMSILQTASPPYARPLGHRLTGKFYRFPLVVAGLAVASLLLPVAMADAAVMQSDGPNASIASQTGLGAAAQQREGRRGGGEFRGDRGGRGGGEFRGGRGGGGRDFRAENRNTIGSVPAPDRQQFRQERRGDVQGFRQERRADRQGFRQERRGDVQDFRQERRSDRRDFRQGVVTQPEFRADRRDDRRDFRQDRRFDNRDFRQDRRDDRRDFRADRRDDRRDFLQDRRFDNRDWRNDRRFDNRGWRDDRRDFRADRRDWNRGWRNDRRYDWYGWRNQNRNFFRAGRYYPPVRGWRYQPFSIGFTLGAPFYASSFWINDPWAFRLPPAYGQYRWVRYYGDVLLVDIYTGEVVDVINDFFW